MSSDDDVDGDQIDDTEDVDEVDDDDNIDGIEDVGYESQNLCVQSPWRAANCLH